ncbi:CCA tRNA nucleotidyltransferase [Algirhabdus cladophorae]|uniref:CCA tRNA nucleotidyltransferase n=1 Tax=Algirhabdus cladophorae TaxID=3377108 RepID=UPI003B84B603
MRTFDSFGHQIYLVGGCVRNAVLNRPLSDIDLASDALPERAMEIASEAGFKIIPTGLEHGTITAVANEVAFEITTFRRDVATDGRHAEVVFSEDVKQDALRRDFTMNALYCDAKGRVVDPLGGLKDARDGVVRFIGNPDDRIQEDYLRILRFFRFTAWYGDPALGLHQNGLAACAAAAQNLDRISKERIGSELLKTLAAKDPAPAMAAMQASTVLGVILPGADTKSLPLLVHLDSEYPPDPLRRLALIGGQDLKENLRLSKVQDTQIKLLRSSLQTPLPELAFRHGVQFALNAALIQATVLEQPISASLDSVLTTAASQVFPLKAADLMPNFQGPALGEVLRVAETYWIKTGFQLSAQDLADWCRNGGAKDAD